MKSILNTSSREQSKRFLSVFTVVLAMYALSFASGAMALTGSEGKVESFFTNIQSLLTIASISVVTIAVIFAGYQIAFANKRIGDVAPVLIGGLLIGAAGQIAGMLLGPTA